jgi:hypothetical protein
VASASNEPTSAARKKKFKWRMWTSANLKWPKWMIPARSAALSPAYAYISLLAADARTRRRNAVVVLLLSIPAGSVASSPSSLPSFFWALMLSAELQPRITQHPAPPYPLFLSGTSSCSPFPFYFPEPIFFYRISAILPFGFMIRMVLNVSLSIEYVYALRMGWVHTHICA